MTQPSCKRPESVLVVVYTTASDVLMLERRNPAGYWQSVTGTLEWGEAPKEAAMRELFEETGLQLQVTDCRQSHRYRIHPAWRKYYGADVDINLEHVFRVECSQRLAIIFNNEEHSGYRWLERDAAANLAASLSNRDAILKHVPAAPHS